MPMGALLSSTRAGESLPPLNQESALAIARSRINTDAPVASSQLVAEASREYRCALPAWRIAFDELSKLAVYVGANNGRVTVRRSEHWRTYDTLWAFHIMDHQEHENFDHAPIIVGSALAFLSTIAGIALIPKSAALPASYAKRARTPRIGGMHIKAAAGKGNRRAARVRPCAVWSDRRQPNASSRPRSSKSRRRASTNASRFFRARKAARPTPGPQTASEQQVLRVLNQLLVGDARWRG